MLLPQQVSDVEEMIDEAWDNHDDAVKASDEETATYWKTQAFDLLSRLPENNVYLTTIQ